MRFQKLLITQKDFYNHFYLQNELPNSDYCFSVIHTWLSLDDDVKYYEMSSSLLLLKYIDVLDDNGAFTNYVIIGNQMEINPDSIKLLCDLAKHNKNKVIVTESHKPVVDRNLPESFVLNEEQDLQDYLYSVDDYKNLDKSDYRRIRREINIFKRTFPDVTIESGEMNILDAIEKNKLINTHHVWDNTFVFNNDPERVEGLVLSRSLQYASELGLKVFTISIDGSIEGFFIYTEVLMGGIKYADVHHGRFSYNYKHLNDYAFNLFAVYLYDHDYEYINFERDAGIEGLRKHKRLLKPVKNIKAFTLEYVKL